jgi:hypothetical protein
MCKLWASPVVVEECRAIDRRNMSALRPGRESSERTITLTLDGFGWDTLDEEASLEGITTEELITFSVLYYLADIDSGRISRRIKRSPFPFRPEDTSATSR